MALVDLVVRAFFVLSEDERWQLTLRWLSRVAIPMPITDEVDLLDLCASFFQLHCTSYSVCNPDVCVYVGRCPIYHRVIPFISIRTGCVPTALRVCMSDDSTRSDIARAVVRAFPAKIKGRVTVRCVQNYQFNQWGGDPYVYEESTEQTSPVTFRARLVHALKVGGDAFDAFGVPIEFDVDPTRYEGTFKDGHLFDACLKIIGRQLPEWHGWPSSKPFVNLGIVSIDFRRPMLRLSANSQLDMDLDLPSLFSGGFPGRAGVLCVIVAWYRCPPSWYRKPADASYGMAIPAWPKPLHVYRSSLRPSVYKIIGIVQCVVDRRYRGVAIITDSYCPHGHFKAFVTIRGHSYDWCTGNPRLVFLS